MTQTTQNKERRVVVEVSSSDPFNKTDIQNAMDDLFNKHGGEPYTVTEIDMTQYVKRSKVEEVCKWADNECNHMIAITVIDRIRERLLNEGGNDEEDTR
jgi:hypothetical protein